MSDKVDEIREQIHEARSDGYPKEDVLVLADATYLRNLRDELRSSEQLGTKDSTQSPHIDGVPVMVEDWMDGDSMFVVTGRHEIMSRFSLSSDGRQSGALGLSSRGP